MRPVKSFARTAAALALCMSVAPAWGHLLNMTEARLTIADDGQVALALRIDLLRSTAGPRAYHALAEDPYAPAHAALWNRLAEGIDLRQGSRRIALTVTRITAADDLTLADFEDPFVWPRMRVELTGGPIDPAVTDPIRATFTSAFMFEEPVALTMSAAAGATRKSRWLVTDQRGPAFVPTGPAPPEAGFDARIVLDAVRQGISHILPGGLDHLLFLMALVLTIQRTRELVLTVTIFTGAHSLTLALAALRIVEVPPLAVELAILASIAWVAALALLAKPLRHGYIVIAAFGLLHGLGFATAFREVAGADAFLWRLFGFNVGIELAQLAFVAVALAALHLVRQHSTASATVLRQLAALTLAVPCVWAARLLLS